VEAVRFAFLNHIMRCRSRERQASQAATLVAGRNSASFAKLRGNNTWRCAPIDISATDSKVRRASGLASCVCRRARSC